MPDSTQSPTYIDVSAQITHVRTETEQERALSDITFQVCHYEAGGAVSDALTQAQEIAHIQTVAAFHQSDQKDFGGGAHGRTIEYTYGIFPSGRIYRLNRETLITWSHRNGNRVGMATVLFLGVGQQPSQAMLATLTQHFDYTCSRADMRVARARTFGHGETNLIYGGGPAWGNDTDCPGAALPYVKQYRNATGGGGQPPMPDGQQNPDANGYFIATGHSIGGAIADYWNSHGGIGEFGLPLEQESNGDTFPYTLLPELKGFTVQRFERQALAWQPGHPVVVVRTGALVDALLSDGHYGASCSAH